MTVLNGHIHQIVTQLEGDIRFASADATAYPQPKPGAARQTRAGDASSPASSYHAIGYRTAFEIDGSGLRFQGAARSVSVRDAALEDADLRDAKRMSTRPPIAALGRGCTPRPCC